MGRFSIVLALLFFAKCAFCHDPYEQSAQFWTKSINENEFNWKAGYNEYLRGKSMEDIQGLMGSIPDPLEAHVPIKDISPEGLSASAIPKAFVAGTDKWQRCASTIGFIKDQAQCGSCWAVSASSVIGDRICIQNYAKTDRLQGIHQPRPTIDMSSNDIMSCCHWCGKGCHGGSPILAIWYWGMKGVVSGGWFGSRCGCQPYQIRYCRGHCQTPNCTESCAKGYWNSFKSDKHFAQDYYRLSKNVTKIQKEILDHGPVVCSFNVYENFLHYKSGVYDHVSGKNLGGHAVKILGWGEEKGVPYWLINNSWNVTWGDKGQFKFLRGKNLAGMEGGCSAGIAKAGDHKYLLRCY